MSDYEVVSRGSLKLKNNLGLDNKSKKKKKKLKEKQGELGQEMIEKALKNSPDNDTNFETDKKSWMTEAQKKFLSQQEKRQLSRVMEKASKSHKQRVEDFNSHLESLSEHYDIPKVSWTK